MVNAQLQQEGEHATLILMPNNSASWQQAQVFLLSPGDGDGDGDGGYRLIFRLGWRMAYFALCWPEAGGSCYWFYYVSLVNTTKKVITFLPMG